MYFPFDVYYIKWLEHIKSIEFYLNQSVDLVVSYDYIELPWVHKRNSPIVKHVFNMFILLIGLTYYNSYDFIIPHVVNLIIFTNRNRERFV